MICVIGIYDVMLIMMINRINILVLGLNWVCKGLCKISNNSSRIGSRGRDRLRLVICISMLFSV